MLIVLIGPPGAGKGTQSQRLVSHLGIPHFSTGEMLRQAVLENSQVGLLATPYLNDGRLVPDAIVAGVVGERLEDPQCARGCLLDGFPRTVGQAVVLDGFLRRRGRKLAVALELRLGRPELLRRLAGRLRADDTIQTITHRLDVYRLETEPILAYYDQQKVLRTIDAGGTVDEVFERIRAVVDPLRSLCSPSAGQPTTKSAS